MTRFVHYVALATITLSAGCADDMVRATTPSNASNDEPSSPKQLSDGPSDVEIDKRIVDACGLSAPRFKFDSSKISSEAAASLDAIASCLTGGPLGGRAISLIGHADPRGEVEYNLALGHRRAATVASYLEERGMETSAISTSSRGELDATGTGSASWAKDRRVDIALRD